MSYHKYLIQKGLHWFGTSDIATEKFQKNLTTLYLSAILVPNIKQDGKITVGDVMEKVLFCEESCGSW